MLWIKNGVDFLQAQAQTYDGYVENGLFYPRQTLTNTPGRLLAVLTVIEVPVESDKKEASIPWWEELEVMVRSDTTPKLRIEDFPRLDLGREPIIFTNED
jgi:hypothetical protein